MLKMKKQIVIIGCLVAVMSIVGFVAVSQPDALTSEFKKETDVHVHTDFSALHTSSKPVDFHYGVGSRFFATISKEDLHKATTVTDLLPPEADWSAYPIQKVIIKRLDVLFEAEREGTDLNLTEPQLTTLRSCEYGNSFRVMAWDEYNELNYFITVIPEKEASYKEGMDALVQYLRQNSASVVANVSEDKLRAGQMMFTVDEEGDIADVKLTESSGYPAIDNAMDALIRKTSGKWKPAANADGAKVEQKLMFSFGRAGC